MPAESTSLAIALQNLMEQHPRFTFATISELGAVSDGIATITDIWDSLEAVKSFCGIRVLVAMLVMDCEPINNNISQCMPLCLMPPLSTLARATVEL